MTADTEEPFSFDDGAVISKAEVLYSLNTTAQEILSLFDGIKSVADVINEIVIRYSEDDVGKDTEDFINYLFQTGILMKK